MTMLQHGMVGAGGGIDVGDIKNSLRFSASRSTYLSRTFVAPTDNNVWTYSAWVKRGALAETPLLTCFVDSSNYTTFRINSTAKLEFLHYNGAVLYAAALSGPLYRDPTSHMHIMLVGNRAEGTDSNRIKMYVNGVQITSWTTTPTWNAAQNVYLNQNRLHHIGRLNATYADGYLSRICFIDGQALTPSSFGYFNSEINEWVSKSQSAVKAVVDAGGANSFMLDFDNGTSLTTLGYDKSSKGNNWTLNNHSLTAGVNYDWLLDVPGNSYAVLNAVHPSRSTLSNGNLTASGTTDFPTINPDSGTWYFERGGASQTWTPPAAFPSGSGDYNFGQRPWQSTGPTGGQKALCQANLSDSGTVTVSGSFTGNASIDGPFVWMNGVPTTLTINSNAVAFGTHADKLANGFKLRTSSSSYNASGTNNWTATIDSNLKNIFKYNTAEGNP